MPGDEKCLARRERNSIALIFHSRKLLARCHRGSFSALGAQEREKVEATRLAAVIPLRFI
jgi:hypothetical protein